MKRWLIGGGLLLLGWALASGKPKKQLFVLEEKKPAPPAKPTDWSGCGEPPAFAKPGPRFKCGDKVKVDAPGFEAAKVYTINARTWGAIPDDPKGEGLWTYSFAESGDYTEEANLTGA